MYVWVWHALRRAPLLVRTYIFVLLTWYILALRVINCVICTFEKKNGLFIDKLMEIDNRDMHYYKYFCTFLSFSLRMESTWDVLSFRMVFFVP